MKLQLLIFTCLGLLSLGAFALGLDDFVPDFLSNGHTVESANLNPETAFMVPVTAKKRSESSDDWYCDRVNQAFCAKQSASAAIVHINSSAPLAAKVNQGANDQYFNPNSNSYDKNAVVNFNITNSNQTALQGYSPKLNNYTTTDQLKQNIAVPIQADKNTNISVGANQINFNVSY